MILIIFSGQGDNMKNNRRDFLRTTAFGIAGTLLSNLSTAASATKRKPNILLVVTDDQGWGDVTSHNNPLVDTPVMDRLAEEGARLDRFFVSPLCAPTRASLLTGRYHSRTGVFGVTNHKEAMRSNETTLAEIFKSAGYATGCFGKWHNGAHYPNSPNGQGFEEFYGFCSGHWNNYFDTTLEHNGRKVKTKGFINDILTDRALGFIEKNKDRPFLCYVPYNTPHSPFQVPDKYFDPVKKKHGLDDKLTCVYAMCKSIDDNLGRLLEKLKSLNLANDTIVIFFGDNGPNTDRYNGGMRGRKGSIHEGGTRVACFWRWPDQIKPGTKVTKITAHIDLLPTLVKQTGVPMIETKPLDGVDISPLLQGRNANWPDRFFITYRNPASGSVRSQRYRLTLEGTRVSLFDMTTDPGQKTNIAKDNPEIATKMKDALDAYIKAINPNGKMKALPIPVGYAEAPFVELPAHESFPGGGVEFFGKKGWANDWVSNWNSTKGHVYWELDVVRSGMHDFALRYTCPKKDIGSKVCIEVNGKQIAATITKPHDPKPLPSPDRSPRIEVYEKEWGILKMGSLRLEKGRQRLYVRALTKPGQIVMDLKAVEIKQM